MRTRRRFLTAVISAVLIAGVVLPTDADARPRSADPGQSVIVVLKDQLAPGTNGRLGAAQQTEVRRNEQRSIVRRARSEGAGNVHTFATIDAVAMRAPTAAVNRLRQDPLVAGVVPDLAIRVRAPRDADAATNAAVQATTTNAACSTNPAAPILEPEALQLMNVAKADGTKQALRYADGHGVKVAVLADGLDPYNPGFVRDGHSVFADYQDFTGEGAYSATSGVEAFGDASSIAAQPGHVYNVSDYVNEAHARPNGCYIRVSGVAPGADLIGLKVVRADGTALTSDVVRAIEYAVEVDHADVINESFHTNFYPDTALDPIALADAAAVRAGVTVVASTGDSGSAGTVGSPAANPDVIAVGATTSYRSVAQTDDYGYPLPGVTGWADGNISPLSSAGFAQNGKVPDLVAPGDRGWALCSTDVARFWDCGGFRNDAAPVGIQNFGGTSESSPFVAGAAALVISAYAQAHPGAGRPSPGLVKRLLASTAHDLGHPSQLQGAGAVDALAAVRAAMSAPDPSGHRPAAASGANLLPDRTQVDLSGRAGSTVSAQVRYRNDSASTQAVTATTRSLTAVVARTSGTIAFDPATLPWFLNVSGAPRYYTRVKVLVHKDVDRLDASLAWSGGGTKFVYASLIDPAGRLQSYSFPQGPSNFAHVDAAHPRAGVWTMYVFGRPDFTGAVAWQVTQSRFGRLGTVFPARVRLAPGRSVTFTLAMPASRNPGDTAASLQLRTTSGLAESLPVAVRSTITATAARTTTFHGSFTGGDGRATGGTATSNSFYLDVPRARPDLAVGFRLTGQTAPGEVVKAYLISPQNEPVAVQTNVVLGLDGVTQQTTAGVQLYARAPGPGRWHVVLEALDPVSGDRLRQPFIGYVSVADQAGSVQAALPNGAAVRLMAGRTVTARVRITNTGVVTRSYFTDARRSTATTYPLTSQLPGNDLHDLPIDENAIGYWLVPTRTSQLTVTAEATRPVTLEAAWSNGLDGGYPDVLSTAAARHVTARITAAELAQGYWRAQVAQVGPYATTAPPGTVSLAATVHTATFDTTVASSTGDLWLRAVSPAGITTAFAPITLAPGQTGTIAVHITPRGTDRGRVVSGRLDVDTYDPWLGVGDVLATRPYQYVVG